MRLDLFNRLLFALIGFVFGAVLGLVGWWLYGLGFSLKYDGRAIDPAAGDWIRWSGALFALAGFIFRAGAADALLHALRAIFVFETDADARTVSSIWVALLLMALVAVLICFGLRSR